MNTCVHVQIFQITTLILSLFFYNNIKEDKQMNYNFHSKAFESQESGQFEYWPRPGWIQECKQ